MLDKKKVILDVDTGIDDALAILYALNSPSLIIEGITTAFGNTSLENVVKNTFDVIQLNQSDTKIPVFSGAKKPLVRDLVKKVNPIHGKNGLADYEFPEGNYELEKEDAADFIIRKINEEPGKISLIMTGRLTNLATALMRDASIVQNVHQVVLMGGALRVPGNVTPVSEANIYGDPEAAHYVFVSGLPIQMVGLDVTSQVSFGEEHLKILNEKMPPQKQELLHFLNHIFTFSFQASDDLNQGRVRLLHDPLAVGVVVDPTLVETEAHYVHIETDSTLSRGATLIDLRTKQTESNAKACVKVNADKFINQFIDRLISI